MANPYVGFRVEVPHKIIPSNFKQIIENFDNDLFKVVDYHIRSRIKVEKLDGFILAKSDKSYDNILNSNFSVLVPIASEKQLQRIIKIINVLGNDKLLKEKLDIFVAGRSALNQIPELKKLSYALEELQKVIPNLVDFGWFFAPEAIY